MGIVLGALGGMGDAMQKIGATNQKALLDEDKARLDSSLALDREKTMLAFRNEAELKQIPLKAKATAGATLENAPTLTQANSIVSGGKADDAVRDAPKAAQAKLLGELSPEVIAAQAGKTKADTKARTEGETEALTARGTDKDALAAIRNIAQAGHVEGLGSVMQAKLAQMGIEEKTAVNALIAEYTSTKDPDRKTAIKESLTIRGIIKPGEYDTEKITEESYDDKGNLVKRERTQKRRPDGSAGPAAKQDVRVAGQVIGQASSPQEARALVEKWKTSKADAPRKAAPAAARDGSQERELRALIMDKRSRLQLPGIGPEAKTQLLLDLQELEGRLNGKPKSVLR